MSEPKIYMREERNENLDSTQFTSDFRQKFLARTRQHNEIVDQVNVNHSHDIVALNCGLIWGDDGR